MKYKNMKEKYEALDAVIKFYISVVTLVSLIFTTLYFFQMKIKREIKCYLRVDAKALRS